MTTPGPTARFEEHLTSRARIGWGGPVTHVSPRGEAALRVRGGFPDPASFPYDGMVEATAKMMKAEGADALTYGDPQGYRGCASSSATSTSSNENLSVTPEEHLRRQRLGRRAGLASAPSWTRASR